MACEPGSILCRVPGVMVCPVHEPEVWGPMNPQNPPNPDARSSKAASLDAREATTDAAMCSTLDDGCPYHADGTRCFDADCPQCTEEVARDE